jgi:predicted ATPase/transcriptional regulator with XRE-family HTH domain
MHEGQEFGLVLRRHRVAAGLTQEQLADRAGLSVRAVTDLERGARRFPYRDTIARLADALELDEAGRAILHRAARRITSATVEQDAASDSNTTPGTGASDAAGPRPRHNIPAQVTSFVGRQAELAEVKRLLAATRLLTLTGAGGSGKTRLALTAANDLLEDYPEGIWVADLAPLSDPELVPHAVASLVGARQEPGRELRESIATTLQQAHVLLLLDNCEHLIAASAQLVDTLIRGCPRLHILTTSREPLSVPGETTWLVPPLRAADPLSLPQLDALTQYEAVRLFVDRAMSVQPAFAVTNKNAPAVAQICYRLDGIPLAIELAAARIKVLTPEEISARLDDRFHLLTGGHRVTLPRQRTLRALVDWSHHLLSDDEKVLFRRLSVFAGGWTLEAAEAVCASEPLDRRDILDLLSSLVDKSLAVADEQPDGRTRYRVLETLREYGSEQLRDAGEAEVLHKQHLDWCVSFAERVEPELWKTNQSTWLQRLEDEHDNFRSALDWSAAHAEHAETSPREEQSSVGAGATRQTASVDAGLKLAAALGRFWHVRGHFGEGRARLETQLRLAPGATSARLRASAWAAALDFWLGDHSSMRMFATEALVISGTVNDSFGRALALRAGPTAPGGEPWPVDGAW